MIGEEKRRTGRGRLSPRQLGSLDPAVEEGGKREGQGGWPELGEGRPGTSFFHFKHWETVAGLLYSVHGWKCGS